MNDGLTSRVLTTGAIVGLTFAALLLMAPARLFGLFGFEVDAVGEILARLLAAEFLGLSIVNLGAARDRRLQRPVVLAHFFTELLAGLVALAAVLSGQGNALAWTAPVLFLGFALAYAVLLVIGPAR